MRSGYPSDWDERRRRVYERDDYECQRCGRLGGSRGGPEDDAELHAHHIVPKNEGGTDDISNLETLCHSCHNQIHGHKIDRRRVDRSFSSLIEKSRQSTSASSPSAKSEDSTSRIEKSTDSISYSGYAPDSRGDDDSQDSQLPPEYHSENNTSHNPPQSNSHSQEDSANNQSHSKSLNRDISSKISESDRANRRSTSQTDTMKIGCKICGDVIRQTNGYEINPDAFPDSNETEAGAFYVCGSCVAKRLNQMVSGGTKDNTRPISILLVLLVVLGVGSYFLSFWTTVYYLASLLLMRVLFGAISRIVGVVLGSSRTKGESEDSESGGLSDNDASDTVDRSNHPSSRWEIGDEAWRRKQDQGTIEDWRGPGRF
ncbi:HNH endonuclease [Halobellus sp. EA9]|uniref:HNH endonuclease n=1 Tax=Halobellus sp. EA9 TaxID=3421647 RepID=UPI003EBE96EA